MQSNAKLKRSNRTYSNSKGITLIALVVTIVVLLMLAGVTLNALFNENGILTKSKNAGNIMEDAKKSDLDAINDLDKWIDEKTGNEDSEPTKISTIIGTAVDKNTKVEDAYGNKITIPKGFKILPHGTEDGSATYNYTNPEATGEHIPAVQDGIVIEDTQTETLGNQFVWVPVGTIKNKDNTTSTITLGRYSDFTAQNGVYTPVQSAANYTATTLEKVKAEDTTATAYGVGKYYYELNEKFTGNAATDSTAQNATARDLTTFIETTQANGGYYIARFEASKNTTTKRIESKYNKTVLGSISQLEAAESAREMYGEVKENGKLIYASDLVNSYAWDTAIIFIQTYSTGEDASTYAIQNKSTSFANTGKNADKYCNIWDMSGNAYELTTEYSTEISGDQYLPCTSRGGAYESNVGELTGKTAGRGSDLSLFRNNGLYWYAYFTLHKIAEDWGRVNYFV